jgi:hypothetical protein
VLSFEFAERAKVLPNAVSTFLWASLVFLASLNGAVAQEACIDNRYVNDPDPNTAAIFVSEAATTYEYSNCPASADRLGQTVRLRAGQSLYFWFRVQGTPAYLATLQSRYPFILKFFRNNGNVLIDVADISMDILDRAAMAAEAVGSGGQWDWRLAARKWRFDIPGSYRIGLYQQNNPIPCIGLGFSSQCNFDIEVVP